MKIKVFDSKSLKNIIEINLALVTRVQNECVIGRSPESGIVLDSPDVSRMHGKFLLENGSYYFCDLGSRNGSLVNGRIAETSRKYLLNIGDTIRLGEFVLILEDVNPQPEYIAETVYRNFDATVVSNLRDNVDLDRTPAVNQVHEVVSNVSEPIISTPEEVTIYQEATNIQHQEVSVDDEIVETPQETAQVAQAVGQPIEIVELVDAPENINQIIEVEKTTPISDVTPIIESPTTPVFEEIAEVISNVPLSVIYTAEEVAISQEVTHVQHQKVSVSDDIVETPQETAQVVEAVGQPPEKVELADTLENTNQINESEKTTPISDVSSLSPTTPDTEITPVIQRKETSSGEQSVNQNFDLFTTTDAETSDVQREVVSELAGEITITDSVIVNEIENTVITTENAIASSTTDRQKNDVTSEEIAATAIPTIAKYEVSEEATIQIKEEISASEEVDETYKPEILQTQEVREALVSNNQVLQTTNDSFSELGQVEALAQVSPDATKLVEEDNSIIDDINIAVSAPPEDVETQLTEASKIKYSELKEQIIESKKSEIISTKYIALIAHDSKRWELAEFVTKHQDFFSKSLTIAPLPVSEILSSQSGITITERTSAATSGGYQTIAAKVASGDILAVIFLRDFLQAHSGVANEEAMLRVCNINQVMVATNSPTAEAIVSYIQGTSKA
jgi:methylglyoxal synthase